MARGFKKNDVCIVRKSCFLPGAKSVNELWNALQGPQLFDLLSNDRLPSYWIDPEKPEELDRTYTGIGCEIPKEQYLEIVRKHDLGEEPCHRLFAYLFEALSQLYGDHPSSSFRGRTDLILGCVCPDTSAGLELALNRSEAYKKAILSALNDLPEKEKTYADVLIGRLVAENEHRLSTRGNTFHLSSTLARIADRFGVKGEQIVLDAACASSLAAVELAVHRLKLHLADTVICGGIEGNLSEHGFLLLAKVGALAGKTSVPFDPRSQGMVQSEGAVLFALKRLETAIADGDEILAVIRGIAGTSDGRSASLFEPTASSQELVYGKVHGTDRQLHYLEAHGSGTPIGDRTEAESIRNFFAGSSFPVGASKAIFGHTKGAAGSVGILKSLEIMKRREIPPTHDIQETCLGFDPKDGPYVNREKVALRESPLKVGVSSFGFGGVNYHMCLEEFRAGTALEEARIPAEIPLAVIAENRMEISGFSPERLRSWDLPFKLPPKTIDAIDPIQLIALATAAHAMKSLGPSWKSVPRDLVSVVAACSLGLGRSLELLDTICLEAMAISAEKDDSRIAEKIRSLSRKSFPQITEDSVTGILNNVVAGRICNSFDFRGKSYCIDKDMASIPVALESIAADLRLDQKQLFIFVAVEERPIGTERSEQTAVHTRILSSESFARELELPVLALLSQTELTSARNSS